MSHLTTFIENKYMNLLKSLPFILIFALFLSCTKNHNNLPAWYSQLIKNRVWQGYDYKNLQSTLTNGAQGSMAYNHILSNPTVTISVVNATTITASVWNLNLNYTGTDSVHHLIGYGHSSNAGSYSLNYNYIGDSIQLNIFNIVGSEYGFDDPYVVGSSYTGKQPAEKLPASYHDGDLQEQLRWKHALYVLRT